MQTPVSGSPNGDRSEADQGESFLEVAGVEGSRLRVSQQGLTVLPRPDTSSGLGREGRFWDYRSIRDLRLDDYGSLGVVRARIRSTGHELPLLLLEPDEIVSARRVLEMVWNLMAATMSRRGIA
jgi:hypothetical protein